MTRTLPDYLAPHLEIVFVGINPGEYSARVGHYFARKQNSFWTALNQSGLVPETLTPADDVRMVEFGLGLTDMVKRPTPNASHVSDAEFAKGGQALRAKLGPLSPRIICFNGLYGYRKAFDRRAKLGQQAESWGPSRLFIVPSTSPINAYYRFEIVDWFRRLKELNDRLKGADYV
ncbi:MAG TPA: mismatch-specific DNA-glycosylase [Verrucomicrobiae bacterium]